MQTQADAPRASHARPIRKPFARRVFERAKWLQEKYFVDIHTVNDRDDNEIGKGHKERNQKQYKIIYKYIAVLALHQAQAKVELKKESFELIKNIFRNLMREGYDFPFYLVRILECFEYPQIPREEIQKLIEITDIGELRKFLQEFQHILEVLDNAIDPPKSKKNEKANKDYQEKHVIHHVLITITYLGFQLWDYAIDDKPYSY